MAPRPLEHAALLRQELEVLDSEFERLDSWGHQLAHRLACGGRLLTAGNGGSAAEAQHLAAELVGRYQLERPPLSAISLLENHSVNSAIGNDFGGDSVFARQVMAHGRADDVLICLSTSGRSRNLIEAAKAARERRIATWALTGPGPNPLAEAADEAICIPATRTSTVQEVHLVAVHSLCASVEHHLAQPGAAIGGDSQ